MVQEIKLEEIKEIQLTILQYIDKICKDNEINYSLCGGAMIGAVRNNKFIPWDDDIDILLPRPFYEKLIQILKKDHKYLLLELRNKADYYYPFAKLVNKKTVLIENKIARIDGLGINVDIFPIDGLPEDKKSLKRHIRKLYFYNFMLRNSIPHWNKFYTFNLKELLHRIIKLPLVLISKIFGVNYWKAKLHKTMTYYKFGSTRKAGFLLSAYGEREVMDEKVFESFDNIKFENLNFAIIQNYDIYLTSLYGNYMELPPKEQQKTHHNFIAYWKEDYERFK